MNYFFKLLRALLAIFEPGASKILTNFCAGEAKIPTILALASSKDGSVAIIDTSFSSKTLPSMNPAIILSLLFVLENLVKIFAVEIGSEEIAAAVGPVKYFSKSFFGVSFKAIFVILFFVILKRILFLLILFLVSLTHLHLIPGIEQS